MKEHPFCIVLLLAVSSVLFSALFLTTQDNENFWDSAQQMEEFNEQEYMRYLQNDVGVEGGGRIFLSPEESSSFRVGYPSATKTRYILKLNKDIPNVRDKVMVKLQAPPYFAENTRGFERILQDYLIADIAKNSGFSRDEHENSAIARSGGEVGQLWSDLIDHETNLPFILHKEKDGVTINNESPSGATAVTCYTAPEQLWAKDRLDQPSLPLDNVFGYPTDGGSSVTIYVIDEGVYNSHEEYSGRFNAYYDCIGRPCTKLADNAHTFLCNQNTYGEGFHGTFVAGICCGKTAGIASSASIVSLRALSCAGNGLLTDFLSAIDTAVAHCYANDVPLSRRCVISASMHNPFSQAVNEAADEAVKEHNVVFVNSAGNTNSDACHYSPGSATSTITVAASDSEDRRADYSNHGDCVDMIAPGSKIYSSYYKPMSSNGAIVSVDNKYYAMGDGTSWAAPFVAGAAALYLQSHPTTSAEDVKENLILHSRILLEGRYPLLFIPGGCGNDEEASQAVTDAPPPTPAVAVAQTPPPTAAPTTTRPTRAPITRESALEKLGIGEICTQNSDCNSNACVAVNDRLICTSPIYSNERTPALMSPAGGDTEGNLGTSIKLPVPVVR